MQEADSLEKSLMLRKIEGRRRRGQQRTRQLDGITDAGHQLGKTLSNKEGQGGLACCSARGRRVGHDWVTEQEQQQRVSDLYQDLHPVSWSPYIRAPSMKASGHIFERMMRNLHF